MQLVINKVMYYLEHVGELLSTERDTRKKEALFTLIFDELPTVSDLQFGTCKLACVFKLKDKFRQTITPKNPLGEPAGMVRQAHHYLPVLPQTRLWDLLSLINSCLLPIINAFFFAIDQPFNCFSRLSAKNLLRYCSE